MITLHTLSEKEAEEFWRMIDINERMYNSGSTLRVFHSDQYTCTTCIVSGILFAYVKRKEPSMLKHPATKTPALFMSTNYLTIVNTLEETYGSFMPKIEFSGTREERGRL